MTTSDPIFAAIHEHQSALAALMALDDMDHDDDKLMDALCGEHSAALGNLLSTRPTTVPGCAAVLHYIGDLMFQDNVRMFDDCGLFDEWSELVSGPASGFLSLVADALKAAETP